MSKLKEMKMCKIKKKGLDKEEPQKFKAITEKPTHECTSCGALSNHKDCLCKPQKIK